MTAAPGTLHNTRYQRWSGNLRSARWVWLAIVARGVRLPLKDYRNIVLMLANVSFVLAACTIFYLISLLEDLAGTDEAAGIYQFVQAVLRVDISDVARIGDYRLPLWQTVFVFMIKAQLLYVMIVAARLGPPLIADDLKSNALPIYFARPITPLSYMLGKWLTIGVFIAACTLIPNLLSLIGGVLITGGPGTWGQTLGLAWALLLVGAGTMLVGGLLILAISSLTSDKRFVLVGWLAVVLLPEITQQVINENVAAADTSRLLGSVALSQNTVTLTAWLLGLREVWASTPLPAEAYEAALGRQVEPIYPAMALLGVALVAGVICYRRVVRFSQAAANV